MLQPVVLPGEHLTQHVLEESLAEAAADLGRLEDLLEAGDAPSHVEDALVRLAHLAQAPLHVAHHAPHVLELTLHTGAHLPHLGRHLCGELRELLAHGGRRLRQALLRLVAGRLHLALKKEHGLIGLAPPRLHLPEARGEPEERPAGRDHTRREHHEEEGGPPRHQELLRAAPRPRQWMQTGWRRQGAHTRVSRRFRHWPDMRL